MARLQVFISSTSIDLQEHRKAVFDAIMQAGELGIDMKYFGSRPDDPVDVCLEAIEEADVLVGIYAMRYGWIPEGETRSITEMEFDHARVLGKPCLCYLLDDNAPWPPKFVEYEAKLKLDDFKKKIGQLVYSTFTTPDNLAAKVASDLHRLELKGAVTPRKTPYSTPGKSIPGHRAFFCNRSAQDAVFLPIFLDGPPPPRKLYFYLYGDARQAHTSLSLRYGHEIAGKQFAWDAQPAEGETAGKKWKYRKIKPRFSESAAMNRINLIREIFTAFSLDMTAPSAECTLADLLQSACLKDFGAADTVILLLTLDDFNWHAEFTPAAVLHFIENFCSVELPPTAPRFIFFFGIEYTKSEVRESVQKEVKRAIDDGRHGIPLPELQAVPRRDVAEWFSLPEHEPLIEAGKDEEQMTEKHFGAFDKKDMLEIELILKQLIEQYNGS